MRCGGRLAASTGAFGGRSTVVTAPSVRRAGYTSGLVFTAGMRAVVGPIREGSTWRRRTWGRTQRLALPPQRELLSVSWHRNVTEARGPFRLGEAIPAWDEVQSGASPSRRSVSFSYLILGASTWMSMRSSSGALMRFWWRHTTVETAWWWWRWKWAARWRQTKRIHR